MKISHLAQWTPAVQSEQIGSLSEHCLTDSVVVDGVEGNSNREGNGLLAWKRANSPSKRPLCSEPWQDGIPGILAFSFILK